MPLSGTELNQGSRLHVITRETHTHPHTKSAWDDSLLHYYGRGLDERQQAFTDWKGNKKILKKKTSDDGYEDVLKRKKFFFGTMFGVPKLLLLLVLG